MMQRCVSNAAPHRIFCSFRADKEQVLLIFSGFNANSQNLGRQQAAQTESVYYSSKVSD